MSTSRGEKDPKFGVAFILNEEPVGHPEGKSTIVWELSAVVWTEDTDVRVIGKQVEVQG